MELKNVKQAYNGEEYYEMLHDHALMYSNFFKEGFYISDYHIGNMEFNNGEPILLDLDLLYYSEVLKKTFSENNWLPGLLCQKLGEINVFTKLANPCRHFTKAFETFGRLESNVSTDSLA